MDDLELYNKLKAEIRHHDQLYYIQAQPEILDHEYDALMRQLKDLERQHPDWISADSPSQVVGGVYPSSERTANSPREVQESLFGEEIPVPTKPKKVRGKAAPVLPKSSQDKLNRVVHAVPMLSIDNTYSLGELDQWAIKTQKYLSERTSDDKIEWVVEPKIDGVSGSLIYQNKILSKMITRGNGVEGDDDSANSCMLTNVPKQLGVCCNSAPSEGELPPEIVPDLPSIEVRGEIFMTNENLVELNLIRESESEPPYANTRNLTSGSIALGYDDTGQDILSIDPESIENISDRNKLIKDQSKIRLERSRRKLGFYCHSVGSTEGLNVKTHMEFLRLVQSWGLQPTPMAAVLSSFEQVKRHCEMMIEHLDEMEVEVDGLVIKVNSLAQREILGTTAKSPRWVIAYKFQKYEAPTTVLAIRVQVGKNGTITPVADVTPVEIAGTTVSRASLHNFDQIKEKDIRIGDTIIMEKAGKIIPHVVRVEKHLRRDDVPLPVYQPPELCPDCNSLLVHDSDTVYLRCVNPDCPAQLKEKIRYYASRSAMDISGLGDKNIELLVDNNLIKTFTDIYRLKDKREQMVQLFYQPSAAELEKANKSGRSWSPKSTAAIDNLLRAIESSKRRSLSLLLNGLSIEHVGARTATIITRHFRTAAALIQASEFDICAINEIGPIIASSVWNFFHLPDGSLAHGAVILQELIELGVTNPLGSDGVLLGSLESEENLAGDYDSESDDDFVSAGDSVSADDFVPADDSGRAFSQYDLPESERRKFDGMTIVVTGSLKKYTRIEVERLIESLGGRPSSSVSKKTSFVLAGTDGGSKLKKAEQLGVRIISEEQFEDMLDHEVPF